MCGRKVFGAEAGICAAEGGGGEADGADRAKAEVSWGKGNGKREEEVIRERMIREGRKWSGKSDQREGKMIRDQIGDGGRK